jgi:hypothetical protein
LFPKTSNNGSQGCENPFSTELVRFPILLQTLAENRVSAFLYPLLLPGLEFWIGELFLFIGSQKCNNITMPIEQSQSSKSLRFFPNWIFLFFSSHLHLSKATSAGFFLCLKIARFQIWVRAPVELKLCRFDCEV